MRAEPLTSGRAEHISIEAELESPPRPRRAPRRVLASLNWQNSLRGIRAQIEVLDDHHAHIRYMQPRKFARDYSVDLRFVNAKPVMRREIAWVTLLAAIAAFGVTAALLWPTDLFAQLAPDRQAAAAIITLTVALSLLAVFFHRTTESLAFTTVHGGATLIRVTGGLGSCRKAKAFFVELIKNITVAHAGAAESSQAYLRDEMREHHRLRTCGALTEKEYETSKARILKAHSA